MLWWSIEPILQSWRIHKVKPYIPLGGVLVDIGCDTPPMLINQIKNQMKLCIGLDIVVPNTSIGNVKLIKSDLKKTIPLPDKTADVVTMLAVLEHLKQPELISKEIFRILKPGGRFLLTVPSPANEPVLNVFSALRLVRPEMIDQHENYFTHQRLRVMLVKAGFIRVKVESFELGLNTFVKADKAD